MVKLTTPHTTRPQLTTVAQVHKYLATTLGPVYHPALLAGVLLERCCGPTNKYLYNKAGTRRIARTGKWYTQLYHQYTQAGTTSAQIQFNGTVVLNDGVPVPLNLLNRYLPHGTHGTYTIVGYR